MTVTSTPTKWMKKPQVSWVLKQLPTRLHLLLWSQRHHLTLPLLTVVVMATALATATKTMLKL